MNDHEVHYFSNGTEGHMWMDAWCNRCVNDHCTHSDDPDYEHGCEHIRTMMRHEPIPAMVEVPFTTKSGWETTDWHCMDFRRCPCDRGPDDPPGEEPEPPVHPGQGQMFDTNELMPGVPRGVLIDEGVIVKADA